MTKLTRTFAISALMVASVFMFVQEGAPVDRSEDVSNPKSTKPVAKKVTNSRTPTSQNDIVIRGVPHVRQKPDFCGEACAASWLRKLGRSADQDFVFDQSGLDPLLARGCFTKELATALRRIGFEIGPVWHKIAVSRSQQQLADQWNALHRDLAAGVPSIICMHYSDRPNSTEHFRLILGYDAASDEVIYHEPAEDDGAYRRMKRSLLIKLWPLKYDAKEWQVIRIPLKSRRIAETEKSATFTAADYAQHIMKLKKKLPDQSFTTTIQHPFVVIGDEPPDVVKQRSEATVRWAVDHLKAAYFEKDPTEILDIWLFKDKRSYRKNTKLIFNDEPNTPYGYFSSSNRALVMNIATGGGTLVHEIVHPFVAANFPQCPSWFNEGLGSLYEQSSSRNRQIVGLTNWRLAGLQSAIRRKQVPSFETLCSTSTNEFYNQDKGTNYAQARYLCFYLQEHGLLRKFYKRFRANCKMDPTGFTTLKEVLGRDDMDKFKQEWEAYIMKLRFG